MKQKRATKLIFIPALSALFASTLIGCNPTKKIEDNPTPIRFNSSINTVRVTFDAGDGYVDDTYTLHSKQIDVHKGLTWKYIHNRLPNAYLYNHTFNYWTLHGVQVEDDYQLNSDVTVSADYTAGTINTLQLNSGEGKFSSGDSTKDVSDFTANSTYQELKDAGLIEEPTLAGKIFAGYKDPNGNYIENNTRINFKQPESGKYVFTATFADEPGSFESDSWESLVAASNRGLNYLKVAYNTSSFIGYTKQLTLNDGKTYTLRVIGEEEDTTINGTKAALTFEFENILIPNQAFDGYSHNNNTYAGSSLDNALNLALDNFPTCLKGDEGIRKVKKITNSGMKKGPTSSDSLANNYYKLFALSATEMKLTSVGESLGTNAKVYSFYNRDDLKPAEYIRKYIDSIEGETYNSDYWLRSPDYQSEIACNCMDSEGSVYGKPIDINIGKGVAPAFCIGTSSQKIDVTFNVSKEGAKWNTGGDDDKKITMNSGAKLLTATAKLNTFSKADSTFVGWYTLNSEKELDELYQDDTKVYSPITLYAHFVADSDLAVITFNGNNQYQSDGASKTLKNNDYVANISPSITNSYHQAPTSTRGIKVEDVTDPSNPKAITSFTVSNGKLTIPAKYVTGDISIIVEYGTIAYNKEESIVAVASQDEAYSRAGGRVAGEYARQYFSIGDILNVGVKEENTVTNYRAILIGLGHSTDKFDDNGVEVTSAFTFDFLDMPNESIAYSTQDKPSYTDSLLKGIAEGYYEKINNGVLKNAIKEVSHITSKDYSESEYSSFKSKMFVLSAAEHTSIEESQAPTLEGTQYEFYKKYNDHTKYKNGGSADYWLRTSYISEAGYNRSYYVYSSGDYYSYSSYHKVNYKGVAPAFCI